jgi:hypothetical protein
MLQRFFSIGLFSSIFSFLPLINNKSWFRWSDLNSDPFPVVPFADARMYLNQLKIIIDSSTYPNQIYNEFNHDNKVLTQSGSLLQLWGSLGGFLNLQVFQLYIVMTLLTGVLTYLSLNFLLSNFIKEKINSLLLTSVCCLVVIKDSIGRPSPTQLTLWLVFLSIGSILRFNSSKKNYLLFVSLFAYIIIILTNPFYAIFMIFIASLIILSQRKNLNQKFLVFYSALILISIYYYFSLDALKSQPEIQLRFGVLFDRLPGAFRLSITLFLLICIGMYLYLKSKDCNYKYLNIILIASLLALNSQVFTGIVFEAESHFQLLLKINIFIFLAYISNSYINRFRVASALYISIVVILTFQLLFNYSNRLDPTPYSHKEKHIISLLQNKMYKDSIFLIRNFKNNDLLDYLPIYAGIDLYWNSIMAADSISDSELLSRFACTIDLNYSFEDFNRDYRVIFGHKFINEFQRYPKWDRFSNLPGVINFDELKSEIEKEKSREYLFLMNEVKNQCVVQKYRYKIDFVLESDFRITKISSQ